MYSSWLEYWGVSVTLKSKISVLSVCEHFRTFQKQSEIPVYNIASGQDNPITQSIRLLTFFTLIIINFITGEIFALCAQYADTIPSIKTVAYPMKFVTACRYNYLVVRFFLHTLVAYIIDQVVRLKGGKPT